MPTKLQNTPLIMCLFMQTDCMSFFIPLHNTHTQKKRKVEEKRKKKETIKQE